MSTTANNNQEASSSSSSASINSNTSKERLDSLEEKFDNLFSLVNRFMKQSMNSSNNSSVPSCKRVADDSDTEDEDNEERSDTDSVPTDYQLSDTLMDQFKPLINNQGLLMEGIKNLPSIVKQGYYMVKLDIKKAYLHVLVDPHYRDLFRFVWKGVHYRWKTMPFGLSTAPRIFTMLLRPVLRMLRELNISVIAYLDDLLIFGSTKEECLSNLDNETVSQTRFQVKSRKECPRTNSINHVANRFGINAVTCSKRKEEECHQRDQKLLKARQLYSSKTSRFKRKADRSQRCSHPISIVHSKNKQVPLSLPVAIKQRLGSIIHHPSRCQVRDLKLVNSMEWQRDESVSKLRLCSYNRCFRVRCRCNSKEKKQDHQHLVIPVVSHSIEHVIESSRDARSVNGLPSTLTEPQQLQAEDSNLQHNNPFVHQWPRWSNPGSISPIRAALEAVSQEESQLDWRAHHRILQCQCRPPQPSGRVESQVVEDDQELQLATQEGSIQSHPTSVRSNSDGSVCIAPQPSNDQLLYNQNECTPTRLESMEAVSKDQLIEFHEGFYNTDISGVEVSNMVFNDSNSSSSSSTSSVSSSSGYIPRSINQGVNRINSYSDSTTMEVGDYSTFQSHVKSIINTQKPGTTELYMSSWQPSTLKVYDSNYSRFFSFCLKNSLDPSNITLVVFMDYLTYLFKLKPPLAYSTINSHRSMLNQLLFLKNQTDIAHDPFITRIMTGIHKLRPSSAKYNEIWDANLVFRYLSTINIYPKFTYSSLLHKTLVLCKMFGLARSSDLVKWSFNVLKVTADSIKGPVINAKEQRNTKSSDISILELTSLEDANLSVCPVRHLATYLRSSSKKRNAKSGDSVFIHADGTPLQVDDINKVVISTLSKSGIDVSKFKSHSTRSAMASLLLSNNVPFHVVKKMGRWKSNDTVDTFYDKKIIGEKSGGFLNTVVQLS
ncbi:hypothetical protein ACTFIU_000047 [Dictyostelium citrinum]